MTTGNLANVGVSFWRLNGALFSGAALSIGRLARWRWGFIEDEFLRQLWETGAKSAAFSVLVSALLGFTLLHVPLALTDLAASYAPWIPGLFARVFVEHAAPLTTAFLIIARPGVSCAAELGSMRLSQEIDSVEAIGIDSVAFVFYPRAIALMISGLGLAVLNIFAGLAGGWLAAALALQLGWTFFWDNVLDALTWTALSAAAAKVLLSVWWTAVVCGFFGLRVRPGEPGALGRATTHSVVGSVIGVTVINTALSVTANSAA